MDLSFSVSEDQEDEEELADDAINAAEPDAKVAPELEGLDAEVCLAACSSVAHWHLNAKCAI